MTKTVPEMLRAGADTYEERNKIYGDNYKRHGAIMSLLFPNGLELRNDDDHNRFGIFTQMVAKMTRYGENFTRGGHPDSLHDLMVYTAMLSELDQPAPEEEADPFVAMLEEDERLNEGVNEEASTWQDSELELTEPPSQTPPVVLEDPAVPQK